MDDDDFGGFEAAESYEFGNGEKQTTSPAIAWAAFPTVSEVRISPDVLLEHSVPSACLVPSDSFSLSSDNMATAIQTANNPVNPCVLEEQIQADIPVASLNVLEDKTSVTSAIALVDAETQRTSEPKSNLQQAVANLEIKLCTAEEEKLKTEKELEYLLEKHSILEMELLKGKKEKVVSHQDHYKTLQYQVRQSTSEIVPQSPALGSCYQCSPGISWIAVVPPGNTGVDNVSHEDQSLRMCGFFLLSEEGLIYIILL
ncbi:PREDICTED: coiled-coil domain-containing protein 91-like [Buceros rhinoceros silvestris]|uniref:coiled-coil domain-containing protein 91-like n=1 Tax=Buceros rhinoceros silvestris TaxID=175836 RepID=UPI000529107B|nr:PREDICTED: coiled-coil domain-containing protein 91-like [Buceros rhinoceros silvestris]